LIPFFYVPQKKIVGTEKENGRILTGRVNLFYLPTLAYSDIGNHCRGGS